MRIIQYETKILENNPSSLRTTVPKGIRDLLDVNLGDSLIWKAQIDEQGVKISVQKKIE